jgi:hypothetical protein
LFLTGRVCVEGRHGSFEKTLPEQAVKLLKEAEIVSRHGRPAARREQKVETGKPTLRIFPADAPQACHIHELLATENQ